MILAFLFACAGGADDDSGPVADACADVPVVTYETFGAGFFTQNCQSCHASTQTDREGAPETVTFDTVDDIWHFKGAILNLAASEPPRMPPLGGTTAEDRQKLRDWLTCAEEGT